MVMRGSEGGPLQNPNFFKIHNEIYKVTKNMSRTPPPPPCQTQITGEPPPPRKNLDPSMNGNAKISAN